MNIVISISILRKNVWIITSIPARKKAAEATLQRVDCSPEARRSQRSITAAVTKDGIRAVKSMGSHIQVELQNSLKNISSQKNKGGLSV